MQSPPATTTEPDPSDPNKPIARTSHEYVNGNGKRIRLTISGNQREDIDLDLYIEALLTVAQEIVGNSKQGPDQQ